MSQINLARELLETYRKHGWELRRVLASPDHRAELQKVVVETQDVIFQDATINALWFSRPSHSDREAWELRLVSENPYALFQTFEADETEELREDARMEMEAQMRERLAGS